MNTQRQQLAKDLARLRLRYEDAMRGRMTPSTKAVKLKQDIDAVQAEITYLDRCAAERLALEKAPIDDVLEVIAIPLLADVMNDLVAGVDGMLCRNGCQQTGFGDYTRRLRQTALAMVDTLSHAESNMPRLLDVDDTLVDAVKKKLMPFIKQRLNITK